MKNLRDREIGWVYGQWGMRQRCGGGKYSPPDPFDIPTACTKHSKDLSFWIIIE